MGITMGRTYIFLYSHRIIMNFCVAIVILIFFFIVACNDEPPNDFRLPVFEDNQMDLSINPDDIGYLSPFSIRVGVRPRFSGSGNVKLTLTGSARAVYLYNQTADTLQGNHKSVNILVDYIHGQYSSSDFNLKLLPTTTRFQFEINAVMDSILIDEIYVSSTSEEVFNHFGNFLIYNIRDFVILSVNLTR